MDKKDFESLLKKYPDCVSDGKKLKAFLKDLFPDVPKAIVNTLTIMADDGIISEMQKAGQTPLVSARLQKKLEDDYGLSQKIIAECFSLIIYDSVKQPQTTNNARSHENINASAHTTSKSASKKENFPKNTTKSGKKPLPQSIPAKNKTIKQTNTNFAFDSKDFEIENGTLKKYKGSSSVVVIPDSVTSIGYEAFYDCYRLTSITIPDSVTSIDNYAFSGCTRLTSVTIPDSVTSIGERAFSWCSLTRVTIPDSMTSIGDSAFRDCCSLKSVTIPDSVTSIGDSAFEDCTRLTSVTIPNSVTSIGKSAFYNCCSLKSVTIPDSVTSIGGSAFSYCNNLQDIYITDIATWCNISGLNYLMDEGYSNKNLYLNNELATSITIPNGVTAIPSYAFRYCTGLTSVTIPDSVTSIGDSAFEDCTRLTSVTIPNSVTSIGKSAFSGCTGLTSITIPDSVTSIDNYAFSGCSGLTSITIPDSVTSIGHSAFSGCTGLTSITIPDSVTSIGNEAFRGCTRLTSVTIGGSVTSIGGFAFYGCNNLQDIYITDIAAWCNIAGLSNLMGYGASNKKFYINNELATSITIPNGVTAIPSYAFRGCTGLTSVTIPDSVTSVGSNPFSDCTGLTSITVAKGNTKYHSAENCLIETESKTLIAGCKNSIIPTDGSVTSIGFWAFKGCTGLTSVAIPDSVTSIGGSAFNYCTGLTSITIPDSVTSIGDYAFQDCTSLTSITVAKGNTKYHSAENCLIETESKTLIAGCKNSIIPTDGSVTSIGFWAFKGCTGLTSVSIPDSVTSIGDYAFQDCTSLTSVTIPDSVTSIGYEAFSGCRNLTINCEAKSKPIRWSSSFNPEHRPVVWGVKK